MLTRPNEERILIGRVVTVLVIVDVDDDVCVVGDVLVEVEVDVSF